MSTSEFSSTCVCSSVLLHNYIKQLIIAGLNHDKSRGNTCQTHHDSANLPFEALYMVLQHAGDLHAVLNSGTLLSHSVTLHIQQL